MPRGKRTELIPRGIKVEFLQGDSLIKVKEAARLSDVHPVVLEMGRKLLDKPGGGGR